MCSFAYHHYRSRHRGRRKRISVGNASLSRVKVIVESNATIQLFVRLSIRHGKYMRHAFLSLLLALALHPSAFLHHRHYLHLHPAHCVPSLYVTTDGHPYLSQRYKEQRQTGKYKFCVIQHRNLYLGVIWYSYSTSLTPIQFSWTRLEIE